MLYHRQCELLPLHTLGTSPQFHSRDDLLTFAASCRLDATHLILQNLPAPFHGLYQSHNFMEGKYFASWEKLHKRMTEVRTASTLQKQTLRKSQHILVLPGC